MQIRAIIKTIIDDAVTTDCIIFTTQNMEFDKLLGVDRDDEMAYIRAGYRKMCRKWHPGKIVWTLESTLCMIFRVLLKK